MHVGGFTRHPTSGIAQARRGTYAGLVEKIPYLKDLGITAVELLPVFQFDAQDAPAGKTNVWGYAPLSFFAPASRLQLDRRSAGRWSMSSATWSRPCTAPASRSSSTWSTTIPPRETSDGPTLCFRGLDNGAYYILDTATGATSTTAAAATP
ncbi:MAG: alpha-amylase family glycosyl hydrolase [Minicystis sp.]